VRADDLAAFAVTAALERVPQLDRSLIEDLILGCAFPEGEQGMNLARLVGALAGLPETVAGVTVNRFCASSLQAVNMAAQNIMLGYGDVFIAGGVESMSRVPMMGFSPSLNPRLMKHKEGEAYPSAYPPAEGYALYSYIPMGLTAENLARDYHISRQAQDAFALRSHQKAVAAIDSGFFQREIVPVTLPDGSVMQIDEGPRRDTTLEKLASLEPAFNKQNGTVTAGNSSPLNDGAAAAVLMSAEKARELGITPLAKIISMGVAGVRPDRMGIGPAPAMTKALQRAGLQLSDMEIIEINEAFAAQTLSVVQVMDIDVEKLNPHGGALALGHPLGCSGARIIATLVNELQSENKTLGIATLCIGGGQGLATILERVS